jgi:hypothetical protein
MPVAQTLRLQRSSAQPLPSDDGITGDFQLTSAGTSLAKRRGMLAHSTRVRPIAPSQRVRLIAVERGSAGFCERSEDESVDTVAIAQTADESSIAFCRRILTRLAALERAGESCVSALLICGLASDHATLAARRLIALALSTHAHVCPSLHDVLFQAPATATPSCREQLFELADELMSLPRSGAFDVRVRFLDEVALFPLPPKSDVFPIPPRAP